MADPENPSRAIPLPHPDDIAARKALAAMPPAPIERILQQAAASRKFIDEWRAKGLPDLPLPPHLIKRDPRSWMEAPYPGTLSPSSASEWNAKVPREAPLLYPDNR